MADYGEPRRAMVDRLRRRGIGDACVLAAMGSVPRERFTDAAVGAAAYADHPLSIGAGQTISAPWIVAYVAQELHLTPRSCVLEVGAGSGYAAAVMSRCAQSVVGIERIPELGERAARTLRDLGYDNVEIRVGDGYAGAPDRAPFDAIAVSAMAVAEPPPSLLEQLAPGGTLICPVGGRDTGELLRIHEGRTEALAPVAFVPLVHDG